MVDPGAPGGEPATQARVVAMPLETREPRWFATATPDARGEFSIDISTRLEWKALAKTPGQIFPRRVIVPAGDGLAPGYHHFSLELDGRAGLDDAAETLAARGIPIVRRVSTARKQSLFLRDPDGMMVEMFSVAGGAAPATCDPFMV